MRWAFDVPDVSLRAARENPCTKASSDLARARSRAKQSREPKGFNPRTATVHPDQCLPPPPSISTDSQRVSYDFCVLSLRRNFFQTASGVVKKTVPGLLALWLLHIWHFREAGLAAEASLVSRDNEVNSVYLPRASRNVFTDVLLLHPACGVWYSPRWDETAFKAALLIAAQSAGCFSIHAEV